MVNKLLPLLLACSLQAGVVEQYKGKRLSIAQEAERATKHYAEILGWQDWVPVFLCMWNEESHFSPGLANIDRLGKAGEFGIGQVMPDQMNGARRFWERRGVRLGSICEVDTQVALGLAVFAQKIRRSLSLRQAIHDYNGGEPHRVKVLACLESNYGLKIDTHNRLVKK